MKYVAGFYLSEDSQKVVLLQKARPPWQAGRYNAVGGKVEQGETSSQAMIREFQEETGVEVTTWEAFAELHGPDWDCTFFRAWGDVDKCQTIEAEEPVKVFDVENVKLMSGDVAISNVPWLLGMALNTRGGLKLPTRIEYL